MERPSACTPAIPGRSRTRSAAARQPPPSLPVRGRGLRRLSTAAQRVGGAGWLVLLLACCRGVAAPCPGLSVDVVSPPQSYVVYSADPAHVLDIHLSFVLSWPLEEEDAGGQDVEAESCSLLCKHQAARFVLYDNGLRRGVVGDVELGEQTIPIQTPAGHYNISLRWEGADGSVCAEAWAEQLVVATRLELVQAPWGARAGALLDIQPSGKPPATARAPLHPPQIWGVCKGEMAPRIR
ncbi:hypothetical protein T484DRAFT_1932188 [Baffinella frigidus]|nr:hypothetical protein T484DRAFT_1932188 [Cryptophyta sp. CCMP2293]